MRYAAAMSLNGLRFTLGADPKMPESLQIGLCLTVYETLNDDHDDIRELGAKVALRIVAAVEPHKRYPPDVVPSVACYMLCAYLVKNHYQSTVLVAEAIRRLVGKNEISALVFPSFRTTLLQAARVDVALFGEEKQNLYLDEVREADAWSRILMRLSTDALPKHLGDGFTEWVMDGLDVLTTTAKSELDGPLGWTSKPEVFTLGWRVIHAADVVLNWRTRSRKINMTGSFIKQKLRELADAGEKIFMHEIWLCQIETVLERSVLRQLQRVGDVLNTLPGVRV